MSDDPILLIAEDDKTQQKVLSLLAEKYGFAVVIAETGEKALVQLSKPFDAEDFRKILLKWAYNANKPNLKLLPNVNA